MITATVAAGWCEILCVVCMGVMVLLWPLRKTSHTQNAFDEWTYVWFVCNVTSNQFGPYRMCSLLGSVQSAFLSLCLMHLGSVFVLFRFCFYIFFIFCLSFWKWIFLFSSFFSAELNKYITTHYWLIIGIQVHFVFLN